MRATGRRRDVMSFLRVVWLVMRKDLLVELRSREILYTTLFFAVSCVLVFAFGFVREGQPMGDVGAGILWIAVAFSGTLALGRAFERERQSETLRALLHGAGRSAGALCGKADRRDDLDGGGRDRRGSARRPVVPGAAVPAPADAAGAPAGREPSASPRSGRCSAPCSRGPAAGTCCCRCCCIRSPCR